MVGLNEKTPKETNTMTEDHCIIQLEGCCIALLGVQVGETLVGPNIPTFCVT